MVKMMDGTATLALPARPSAALLRHGWRLRRDLYALLWLVSAVRAGAEHRRAGAPAQRGRRAKSRRGPTGCSACWASILLGAAYCLAVSIKNPLDGDRMVLCGGDFGHHRDVSADDYRRRCCSAACCRRISGITTAPNHFVSVSSMAYRMKRNGAGLASICILATMVLVMISSTSSLYFRLGGGALARRYPRDLNIDVRLEKVLRLRGSRTADMLPDSGAWRVRRSWALRRAT